MNTSISRHPQNKEGDRYEVRYILQNEGEIFDDSFEDIDLAFDRHEEVVMEKSDGEPLLLDCNVVDLKTGKLWGVRAQTGERIVKHNLEVQEET